jgi:hypothetical protein
MHARDGQTVIEPQLNSTRATAAPAMRAPPRAAEVAARSKSAFCTARAAEFSANSVANRQNYNTCMLALTLAHTATCDCVKTKAPLRIA